ncbi:MAG: heme NO-binding domain-containing protein [Deltaproteobacteria bacterium]|nr:heme NO-binding domain-containing protein [Deltaproteobacteria bacterium]
MKGTIIRCLDELVTSRFGGDKWKEILRETGLPPFKLYIPLQDVDDDEALRLIQSTCKVLGLSLQQAADAFGEYWMTVYAPKVYKSFLEKAKSARDFLLAMDQLHTTVTSTMANARPPHFDYEWTDPKTLHMIYKSHRNLLPLLAGLARGVGKYYGQDLEVSIVPPNRVRIVFP